MLLDYLDTHVFEPVYKNDLPNFKTKSLIAVATEVFKAIKNNLPIFVYGDYDVDGLSSILCWKETFRHLYYDNVRYFNYVKRTHNLDHNIINQLRGEKLIIVCDTGSSSKDSHVLSLLELTGATVVVIDHHSADNYVTERGNIKFFNVFMERESFDYAEICGAYASLLVIKYLCNELIKSTVPSSAKVYALSAMYADCVNMSTAPARALYNVVSVYKPNRDIIMKHFNKYKYKYSRRFFCYIVNPKLNSCFRSETFEDINTLINSDDTFEIGHAVNNIFKTHERVSKYIEPFANEFVIEDYGEMKLAILDPSVELTSLHISNYSGLIASHLANKFKCAVITAIRNGRYYKGSYRDFYDRQIKEYCALFMDKAEGHNNAFGVEFGNINNVRKHLRVISDYLPEPNNGGYKVLSSNLFTDELDVRAAALYNEYKQSDGVLISHILRNIRCVKATKYYSLYSCGLPMLLRSDKTLIENSTVLVEPCITSKVELRTAR